MKSFKKGNNSSKRGAPDNDTDKRRHRGDNETTNSSSNTELDMEDMENDDNLAFEDPFEDEFEEEEFEEDKDVDDDDEDDEILDGLTGGPVGDGVGIEKEEVKEAPKKVWRPNVDKLEEGEELEYDPSAYIMYHSLNTEWPCLSFDILKDNMGDNRQRFPLTMYLITGSQADKADRNRLTLLKLSELHKTHVSADSDGSGSDEDDNIDEDPSLDHINVPHMGGVNRVRSCPQNPGIIASMADTGSAHIFDLTASYKAMMEKNPRPPPPTGPAFTFRGHKAEGYALDWSSVIAGRLATGDCNGAIHIWNQGASSNAWSVDPKAYIGHNGSVEDLQWSPGEASVFASCSSDRTVKVWDVRGRNGSMVTIDAHTDDVNVISWNKLTSVSYLLASGCDDGSFKVWDLRYIRDKKTPLANFCYHKGPITSIEWAPHDESVLCVSSADNQVTVWDLSVEADTDAINHSAENEVEDFPPQLLFIHQGQYNVKEVHHHPQIPGVIVSTAEDSFNVFKPAISAN